MDAVGRVAPRTRIPVIITTDAGTDMDDQWVIAHTSLAPELDVKAVLGSHAPNLKAPASETSSAVARDVLAHVHPPNPPPVIPGNSECATRACGG